MSKVFIIIIRKLCCSQNISHARMSKPPKKYKSLPLNCLVGSPDHYSIYKDNSITLKAEAICSSKTLVFTHNHTSSQNALMVSLIMGRLIWLKAFTIGQ